MNIRKRKTKHPFTITPNELINHPTLSAEAKFLVIYIESKPETWKARSYDMRRALGKWDEEEQERKAIGRGKFSGIMKELVAAGYAELQTLRGEGGKVQGKEYIIGCSPSAGKTDSRKNRQSEKPTVEKPGHIVKKEDYKGKSNKKEKTNTRQPNFPDFALVFQALQNAFGQSAGQRANMLWVKLSQKEKLAISKHFPAYIKRTAPKGSSSELQYRRTLTNYLQKREWENPLPADPTKVPSQITSPVLPSISKKYPGL